MTATPTESPPEPPASWPAEPERFAVDEALAALDAEYREDAVAELHERFGDAQRFAADYEGDAWLPGWFCRESARLDAEEAALKAQYAKRRGQLDARRLAMRIVWRKPLNAEVDRQLAAQAGKKRSIETEFGRCGYRATAAREGVVVHNETAALAAAAFACPDAISATLRPAELLAYTHKTGEELPGTRLTTTPKRDTFYAGSERFDVATGDAPK